MCEILPDECFDADGNMYKSAAVSNAEKARADCEFSMALSRVGMKRRRRLGEIKDES